MAEIKTEMDLEISKLRASLARAENRLKDFKKKNKETGGGLGSALFGGIGRAAAGFGKVLGGAAIATAGAATAAAGALTIGLKNAFALGGQFSDLAAQIGSTAGKAQVLAQAFENNGMSAEEMASSINRMQRSLVDASEGSAMAKRAFEEIGLNPADLINGDPTEVFAKVAGAISALESPTERSARAMQIFGRAGARLNVLFNDAKALDNAKDTIGGQADILDKNAAEFDRAADILASMHKKLQGFFVGMGAKLIEHVLPVMEMLNKIDLTGIGQRFGEALSKGVTFLQAAFQELSGGDAMSLIGDALSLAFKKAVNFLNRALTSVMQALGTAIGESLMTLNSFISQGDFWAGLGAGLLSYGNAFRALLAKAVAELLTGLQKVPGFDLWIDDEVIDSMRETAAELKEAASTQKTEAGDRLGAAYRKQQELMAGSLKRIGESFSKGFKAAKDVFDNAPETERLREAAERIRLRAEENRRQNDAKKQAAPAGTAGDDSAAGTGGKPATSMGRAAGSFASAINLLTGQANSLVLNEAKTTNKLLSQQNAILNKIAGQKPPAPQVANRYAFT